MLKSTNLMIIFFIWWFFFSALNLRRNWTLLQPSSISLADGHALIHENKCSACWWIEIYSWIIATTAYLKHKAALIFHQFEFNLLHIFNIGLYSISIPSYEIKKIICPRTFYSVYWILFNEIILCFHFEWVFIKYRHFIAFHRYISWNVVCFTINVLITDGKHMQKHNTPMISENWW